MSEGESLKELRGRVKERIAEMSDEALQARIEMHKGTSTPYSYSMVHQWCVAESMRRKSLSVEKREMLDFLRETDER